MFLNCIRDNLEIGGNLNYSPFSNVIGPLSQKHTQSSPSSLIIKGCKIHLWIIIQSHKKDSSVRLLTISKIFIPFKPTTPPPSSPNTSVNQSSQTAAHKETSPKPPIPLAQKQTQDYHLHEEN